MDKKYTTLLRSHCSVYYRAKLNKKTVIRVVNSD